MTEEFRNLHLLPPHNPVIFRSRIENYSWLGSHGVRVRRFQRS